MGLISAIKSVLGLGDSGGRSRDESTGTNVTVERETDATSERAVKESDATEVSFEDESGTTTEEEPSDDAEAEAGDAASVDEIRGIGPTYAERLADAGVHTVPELATADAAELGSEIGVGESRVANWIERANEN